jgi:hypothetical protein
MDWDAAAVAASCPTIFSMTALSGLLQLLWPAAEGAPHEVRAAGAAGGDGGTCGDPSCSSNLRSTPRNSRPGVLVALEHRR